MCDLLTQGRKANNGTYYVHRGDFSWWMYHPDVTQWTEGAEPEADFPKRIFLWDAGESLLGWCLLTPDGGFLDVFVHPDERGSSLEEAIFAWSENRLTRLAPDLEQISSMWVRESDRVRADLFHRRGYAASPAFTLYLTRPLTDLEPPVQLPPGFALRCIEGPHEAQRRAAAAHAAFASALPIDHHRRRYESFMRSPVYDRTRDLVVIAPDGRVASFCIIWIDDVNKVGLFEPVGTPPEFQGRGLGTSLFQLALERLVELGMRAAIVCPNGDNPRAIQLYESQGFKIEHRLLLYSKTI